MKRLILPLLLFLLAACQENRPISEEEKHLRLYMDEVQHLDMKAFDKMFVIVISGRCGSCTEKTISFIKQVDKGKEFEGTKRIVIVPDNNAAVLDSFKSPGTQFIVDKTHNLEKYGINFPKNIFLEFRDDKLIFKDWLYLDNVDSVALKYKFKI